MTWAALLLVAGVDAYYAVALRTETRARRATNFDVPSPAVLDVELQPLAALTLDARFIRPVITYNPRFVLRQLEHGPPRSAPLQQGSLIVPWRINRRMTLTLREDVSYGIFDYASLSGLLQQQGGRLDQVQAGQQVATASTRTTLSLQARLARRQTLDAGIFQYSLAGVGTIGLVQTPPQDAVGAFMLYVYRVARFWTFGATGDTIYSRFVGGPRIFVTEAGARAGWLFAQRSELTFTLGGALVHVERWRPLPYSRVAVTSELNRSSGRWQLQVAAQILPFVDRWAAAVYERFEVNGQLTFHPKAELGLRMQGQWTLAVLDATYGGAQLSNMDATILWRIVPHVTLDGGGRVLYQKLSAGQVATGLRPQPLQWVAFVGLTFDLVEHI